jgi:hypothetical protein
MEEELVTVQVNKSKLLAAKQALETLKENVERRAAVAEESSKNINEIMERFHNTMETFAAKLNHRPVISDEQMNRVIERMKVEFKQLALEESKKGGEPMVYHNSNSHDEEPQTAFLCNNIYDFILQIEEHDQTQPEKERSCHMKQYLEGPLDLKDDFYLKDISLVQKQELLNGEFNPENIAALLKVLLNEYQSESFQTRIYNWKV